MTAEHDGGLPRILSIAGGSHGMVAGYAAMLGLATAYLTASQELRGLAGRGIGVMADGELVESSVLAPRTFAEAELAVVDATTGTQGLAVHSWELEADATLVRATVLGFQSADQLGRELSDAVAHAVGAALVPAALLALPALAAVAPAWLATWAGLDDTRRTELRRSLAAHGLSFVRDHPALLQHLVSGGGGLLDSLVPGRGPGWLAPGPGLVAGSSTSDAARLFALLLGPDGTPVVRRRDVPLTEADRAASSSVADLLGQLARTNALDAEDPSLRGAIRIQQLGTGDEARFIVYLPGTDDARPLPREGETVRDMQTNYRLVGDLTTTYGDGIREAMAEAGLRGRPVMLVGHSQGGMVATALTADPEFRREFDVRHLVTAGSPTAHVRHLPGEVGALHLEHRGDPVPLIEGYDNPDAPRRVTVTVDAGAAGNPHALEQYAVSARVIDGTTHPSVRQEVEAMRADGFLGGDAVTEVRTYTISRDP